MIWLFETYHSQRSLSILEISRTSERLRRNTSVSYWIRKWSREILRCKIRKTSIGWELVHPSLYDCTLSTQFLNAVKISPWSHEKCVTDLLYRLLHSKMFCQFNDRCAFQSLHGNSSRLSTHCETLFYVTFSRNSCNKFHITSLLALCCEILVIFNSTINSTLQFFTFIVIFRLPKDFVRWPSLCICLVLVLPRWAYLEVAQDVFEIWRQYLL